MVYVTVVVVSPAVPTTTIVFEPTRKGCDTDAAPDVTDTLATVTDAPVSVVVGVMDIDTTLFGTATLYVCCADVKAGDSAPAVSVSEPRVATELLALPLETLTV
jgi:hypothetical protein